ncbi:hypothetical protein DZF79_05360 [Vibrio parahaemolyticus]|nr:hypothetical protein [Vibrio parahaemolyticus]
MKISINEMTHLKSWVIANITTLLVFTIYANFFTDYHLTHLATPSVVIVGGLALYQFCSVMWLAILFERVTPKMVYMGGLIAFVLWSLSFWGKYSMATTEVLAGGINGDPSFRFFDKHAAIQYIYLFGIAGLIYKGTKKNLPDLKTLSVSATMILTIVVGYHLIGYWTVFSQGDHYTKNHDFQVMSKMLTIEDANLKDSCEMFDGVDCFRFNALQDGYPIELLNYNATYTNAIVDLANNPITQTVDFQHRELIRDTLFEDNYSPYYSKSFFFNQSEGIVNYTISNYFGDISVNYLAFLVWMVLSASVFWNIFLNGVGIEHSVRLKKRSAERPSKLTIAIALFTIFVVSPFFGWLGLDYFFGDNLALFFLLLLFLFAYLVYRKANNVLFFIMVVTLCSAPAIYIYTTGLVEIYGTYNPDIIGEYSTISLIVTSLICMALLSVTILNKKLNVAVKLEFLVVFFVVVVVGLAITYVGSRYIFISLVMDSEWVRLSHLMSSGMDYLDFCRNFNFDVCQTINKPDWKPSFYEPLMTYSWYMIASGLISINTAFFCTLTFIHRKFKISYKK